MASAFPQGPGLSLCHFPGTLAGSCVRAPRVGTHMSHPGWVQVTQVVAELAALRCAPEVKCQARSLLVPEVLQGAKTTLRLARGEWRMCSVLWNWVPVL